MVGKRGSLVERFEAKFERGIPTDCWLWKASGNGVGYGMIWDQQRRRKMLATRVSYEVYKGPIPEGAIILHSCDNPACVNPSHLRLGDHKMNAADRDDRGRRNPARLKGESNPFSKLTDGQVIEIRRAYVDGEHRNSIAARFGVAATSIPDFVSGKSWGHLFGLPGCPTTEELRSAARRNRKNNAKANEVTALEIRRRLAAGELGKDLATEFGIHKSTISEIKLRKIWAD